MMYEFNGRSIRIPDEELEANMRLGVSKEEAIQIWLEDNEYEINDEQAALDAKAKDVKINLGAKSEKAMNSTAPKEKIQKEDPPKETLIIELAAFVESLPDVENVVIENKTKIITFSMGGQHYKIDLIRSRK